ncbi:hypothetical protein RAH25_17385, partial [Klebsiella quasipneumoniae subsp. similipneumoniae]|uniref:hypothetical protein n=1 Tax=Klebsiella quasipneumoniae TaxID=1463165 RepID=UPI00300587E5
KRAYCLKTQPATGETYPKSDLFNKAEANPIRTIPLHDGVFDKTHRKPLNAIFITDVPERTKPHKTA